MATFNVPPPQDSDYTHLATYAIYQLCLGNTFNLPAPQDSDPTHLNLWAIYKSFPSSPPTAAGGVYGWWNSNQWLSPITGYYNTGGTAIGVDTVYAFPIKTANAATLSLIGTCVFNTSGRVRMGIYTDDGTLQNPSSLLIDAGLATATSPNQWCQRPCGATLTANTQYWLVYVSSNNALIQNWQGISMSALAWAGYSQLAASPAAGQVVLGVSNTFVGSGAGGLAPVWNTAGQAYIVTANGSYTHPPMIQ